jgi:hypothetical protein
MDEEQSKDTPPAESTGLRNFDKLESLAKSISLVAIPVVVAIMGNQLNQTISAQEANAKYVELALQILAKKPVPLTASQQERSSDRNLRSWAADLLSATSPVKMSKVTQAGLIDGSATLSAGPKNQYSAKIIPSNRIRSGQIGVCNGSSIPVMPRTDMFIVPGTNINAPPVVGHYSEAIRVDCGDADSSYNTVQLETGNALRLLKHSPSGVVTVFFDN